MATKNNELLVLNPEYLKKAGIALETGKDAAANARAAIIADNGGKGYVPQNAASDMVVQIMDYARREIKAGENANRKVCIALASVDLSKGYEQAQDANGKPYTSMLAFAMDILPNLAKSTVAGLLAVGRNIYVPALRNRFGASSSVLLELAPSTLDALKANLSNDATRSETIDVLKAGTRNGGKITQKLAKNIAKVVRDRCAMDNKPAMTATEMLKAAQQDAPALEKLYGKTETTSKPSGVTKNGGNAESKAMGNTDEYNAVKAALKAYISVSNDNDKFIMVTGNAENTASLRGFLRKAMTAIDDNSARLICRAFAELLEG